MFTFIEIKYLDPYLWKKHGLDKPLSTIFWVLANLSVGFVLDYKFEVNYMWSYFLLAASFRFALFNYIYNLVYDKRFDYLGLDWWDRMKAKIVTPFRMAIEGWVLLCGVMQFLYFGCWLYYEPHITITFNILRYCQK